MRKKGVKEEGRQEGGREKKGRERKKRKAGGDIPMTSSYGKPDSREAMGVPESPVVGSWEPLGCRG